MTALAKRDPALDTVWQVEHLLKDTDDLRAYLQLPDEVFAYEPDVGNLAAAEREVGERGIVMVDAEDPLCAAASLFSMADYTVIAFSEQDLFSRLLEKLAPHCRERTRRAARALPGRLWRIFGPEYAVEPYLPPRLFEKYVVRHTGPMVEAIHASGGFARIHCHGRIRSALPHIAAMGADAIDPIEPPPLGDVQLADVRREYGRRLALFGNMELRDIENMEPREFEKVVARALLDGTAGEGRGFVLMPSASPCGRTITAQTLANYRTIARLAAGFRG
jgi:uroporphyrinogen-III decarboxylase